MKGCSEQCSVHRYRARENKANSRFAGRLFLKCPKHGRIGGDANDTDMQAYIRQHATMTESSSSSATPAPTQAADEKKSKSEPAAAGSRTEEQPARKSNWWGL